MATLDERLDKLKADREVSRNLAVWLHRTMCCYDHRYECGWYDEIDPWGHRVWSGHQHKKYLGRARALLKKYDIDTIMTMFETYSSIRS